jgi:hypothetical protein
MLSRNLTSPAHAKLSLAAEALPQIDEAIPSLPQESFTRLSKGDALQEKVKVTTVPPQSSSEL